MSQFGRIVSDDQVEDAVVATLKKWTPTYLAEVERQRGLEPGYYQRPVDSSFLLHTDFDKWPEEMLPVVEVISPGVDDDPPRKGAGDYHAHFLIGVIGIVSGADQFESRRFAHRMGAAIRAILTQKASLDQALDGTVFGTSWLGERNNELPSDSERSIWAIRQLFLIQVSNVLQRGGPINPDPLPDPEAPPGDWPTIPDRDHVTTNLERV